MITPSSGRSGKVSNRSAHIRTDRFCRLFIICETGTAPCQIPSDKDRAHTMNIQCRSFFGHDLKMLQKVLNSIANCISTSVINESTFPCERIGIIC